ncbi:MAG: hypothetical protein II452_01140, partial [Paludibacteraceae bacterium]|nr:hypothetical protein [Paludibacteraceae bacterium]
MSDFDFVKSVEVSTNQVLAYYAIFARHFAPVCLILYVSHRLFTLPVPAVTFCAAKIQLFSD